MHPFFQVSVLEGLSDWDPLRALWSSLWAVPCLMLSSAGVAPLPPGFLKLLSDTVTIFAVFPSLMDLLGSEVNCMLSVPSCIRVTSTFAVGRVAKFVRRQLLHLSRCSITHCGLLPIENGLLFALPCYLPTCHLFRDSRLLGLTLRPSAPVFRCHWVSWTRGSLALAQEAVRVSPFSLSSIFCSC